MNKPKVGISIAVVRDNKIITGVRIGSHGEGTISVPGGHLEGGEEWNVCAARELKEETGIVIPAEDFHYVTTTNAIFEEEKLHYVDILMIAKSPKGIEPEVKEPNKCLGWVWRTLDEMQEIDNLFLPTKNFIHSSALEEALILMEEN